MAEVRLVDHKGRLVPIVDPKAVRGRVPGPVQRSINRAGIVRRQGWLPAACTVMGGSLGATVTLDILHGRGQVSVAWTLLTYAASIVACFGVFLGVERLLGRRFARRAAGLLLDHHLCPSCGYDLRGLEPCDRDLVVCTECGAAWRHAERRGE